MSSADKIKPPLPRFVGCSILIFIFFNPIALWFYVSSWTQYPRPNSSGISNSASNRTSPALPYRIVAANCGAADILSEMIDPTRLAAVPAQVEEYAADPKFWKQHGGGIPRFEKFNAERILGFKPDLVISSAFQDGGAASAIEAQKVPILYLKDYESLEGIKDTIAIVGAAVGAQREAAKMIDAFDAALATTAAALKNKAPVTVVVYSNFGTGYTVGGGVMQDDIIAHAGGVNVVAKQGIRGNAPITFEQLLRLNPDFLLVIGSDGLNSPQAKILLSEPILKELNAVKNRHIAVVDPRTFDALSQYAVRAVRQIAEQFHPEIRK